MCTCVRACVCVCVRAVVSFSAASGPRVQCHGEVQGGSPRTLVWVGSIRFYTVAEPACDHGGTLPSWNPWDESFLVPQCVLHMAQRSGSVTPGLETARACASEFLVCLSALSWLYCSSPGRQRGGTHLRSSVRMQSREGAGGQEGHGFTYSAPNPSAPKARQWDRPHLPRPHSEAAHPHLAHTDIHAKTSLGDDFKLTSSV